MRVLRKIVVWVLGIVAALVLLLAGSVVVDGLIGRGRLDALTNTSIDNPAGPAVRAYVARPSTPGPHPAVIMIHEFWGLKADIIGKADALAQEGYLVIAPDMFRGSSTSWIPRAIYQVVSTPAEQIDGDLDAVFGWLAAQSDVQADKIAIMGFCFGGGTSLRYSTHNPKLAATAMFYGSVITEPERLKALPGPLLGIFGGADNSIPVADVRAMEATLTAIGIPNQISIYDGQPHAFVKSIEEIRQGGPQQQAWDELRAFLRQALQPSARAEFVPAAHWGAGSPLGAFNDLTPARLMHVFVCDRTVRPSA